METLRTTEMKIKIILTGILTLMLANCGEDFLDLSDPGALTTATYFTQPADFETAVNGIYANIRGFHGTNFVEVGSMHSDEARYYLNPELRANLTSEYFADFVYNFNHTSSYWTTFYGWISRSNDVIARIDDVTFSDQDQKDNLKGQALFIRAYAYWWCLRLYGQAVMHLDPVVSLDQTSSPLVSEAEVKAQVLTDVTAAISLLPDKADASVGRITSGAANMLLGDVHLWYGEWADAEAAYRELLNDGYELQASFADVFSVDNKNNDESIFEIQFLAPDYDSNLFTWTIPSPNSQADEFAITGAGDASGRTGQSWLAPTPELIAKYDQVNDERFPVTVQYVHYNYGTVPMEAKWAHPLTVTAETHNNFIVYRYAETLLSLAEAINEQPGGVAEAAGYLDQVRNRAGLPNTTAATQDDLRDAIRLERNLELALEGKRWWDLVRWDVVEDVITPYGASVVADPESYYFVAGTAPASGAFEDFRTTFNLPNDETLYNQEMK